MQFFDIGLHKIWLGALILALNLLVDDVIIVVEMRSSKMEQGWDRVKAASFAYSSPAMPMLAGTLVTVAGFLPIATAASSAGEFTRSIFQVSAIALIISWFAAVIFVPYLGYHLLPDYAHAPKPSKLMIWLKSKLGLQDKADDNHHHDIYNTQFYNILSAIITSCVRYRKAVIAITLWLFALSIVGFGKVQQQFSPDSTPLELMVDLRLSEGASYQATNTEVKKLENWLNVWNIQRSRIKGGALIILWRILAPAARVITCL